MRRGVVVFASIAVVAAAVALFALRAREDADPRDGTAPKDAAAARGTRPDRASARGSPRPPDADGTPARPAASEFAAFDAALTRGDEAARHAAAAALRRLLRTDPTAFALAVRRLLDPKVPEASRAALALVLGTIDDPGTDRALLDALAATHGSKVLERALLLALGAQRTPPDVDEVFDMADRPWGAEGVGSLGITVRREIDDAPTRTAVADQLDDGDEDVRTAAASSLRHSIDFADARERFVRRLAGETKDAPAAVLGESLAGRARRTSDPAERDALLESVLSRAGEPGFDAYRFRMEDDLTDVPIASPQRRRLVALAAASQPFAIRAYAFTVLARTATAGGDDAARETRRLLVDALRGETDAAVRDLAARLLRWVAPDEEMLERLTTAAAEDAAWNVRYTALETLAEVAPGERARRALDAASKDPDERVREHARELASGEAAGRK